MIVKDLDFLIQESIPVDSIEEANEIISLLEKELQVSNEFGNNGVGLAAVQIGILKRVAIVRIDKIKINLVNAKITQTYDNIESTEGCLSLPGKSCKVKRYNQIVVENNLIDYNKFCAYGIVSIVIQHEMDHWDGKMISDLEIKTEINIGSNMPCSCGSKIKYKKCCGSKNELY